MPLQYRYAVSYDSHPAPTLSHSAAAKMLDKGLGIQPPLFPTTTMSSYSRSPYRLPHVLSPARSTPSLDDNIDDILFLSPPDHCLDTPDLPAYDWKEIRKLEDQKLWLEDRETAALGLYDVDLPSLSDVPSDKVRLASDLPSAPASWQPTTISPAEVFYDYDYVRQAMAEQARPSSPSVYSVCSSPLVTPYNDTRDLPPVDDDDYMPYQSNQFSYDCRLSTAKRSREEEDYSDYDSDDVREVDDNDGRSPQTRAPPPKRRRIRSDNITDNDDDDTPERGEALDDDDSGEFKPRSMASAKKFKFARRSRRSVVKTNVIRKPPLKPRESHSRGEDNYPLGPCSCRQSSCPSCEMTCWYTFIRGSRKGQVCKRLFDSGRHLDLRRHKISHAVNEWQMLENGEVTLQEAWWYAVEHNSEYKGLICPNGDCTTTFTRYDALRRHMERQTCPHWKQSPYSNLDSRSVKAQIERDSREKYARISTSKHA